MSLKDAALDYAARGWAVLPLRPHSKTPATPHGVKDATIDPAQVESWWSENPDYNIGIACGEPSGFIVMDFDPRNVLEEAQYGYDEIEAMCSVPTKHASTGGGGEHYLFTMPVGRLRGKVGPGVDIKGTGGYIVAPPSVHPSGGTYQWVDDDSPIAEVPTSLAGLIVREDAPERTVKEDDPSDTRPGTLFNRSETWANILEPHGWRMVDSAGVEEFWCRPGKTLGISATSNYEDSGLLYIFTTSSEFESNRGYDKVGAYAVLNHGGNVEAALAEIKDGWSPPALQFSFGAKAPEPERAYEYTPALPDNHLVSRYIAYGNRQTDAALEYHEAGALMLLSVATAQARIRLAPYPGGLHTNIYAVLVGTTTRSRKSTAQNIAVDLAESLAPYAILPSRITTEALVKVLAAKSGMSSLWTPDEFGMMVAEIGHRDFLRGVEELLLTVYGGKDYVYTTMQGTTTVHDPHLSVLGAATPESLALAGPTAMLGGLLPRFAIVFPHKLRESRAAETVTGLPEERRELLNAFRQVMEFSRDNSDVQFSSAAVAVLNKAEEDYVDKGSHIARLPAMLYKVAALYALGRLSATVQAEDAAAAIVTVGRWRDGATNLQPFLRRKAADIEFDRTMFAALDSLKELGGESHRSFVARKVGTTKQKLDTIQATLVDRGYISVSVQTGTWKVRD